MRHQIEVDFMGKITGKVVAVIPIVYPNLKPRKTEEYHQNIYGMSFNNNGILTENIPSLLENNQNPYTGKAKRFGKFIHLSIVNLAYGIAFAFASSEKKFLCTSFTKDKKLLSNNLKFDYEKKNIFYQ